MQRWVKCIFAIFVVFAVLIAMVFCFREQKNCCLCSSGRYHAPCLIDLNTGALVELALYVPHKTKAAELAEVQSEVSTFSYITLGDVSGIKLTGSHRIQLEIPRDSPEAPKLCRKCRQQLPSDSGRYIFADLYAEKVLIPVEAEQSISLRCYQITTAESPRTNKITATVQGCL